MTNSLDSFTPTALLLPSLRQLALLSLPLSFNQSDYDQSTVANNEAKAAPTQAAAALAYSSTASLVNTAGAHQKVAYIVANEMTGVSLASWVICCTVPGTHCRLVVLPLDGPEKANVCSGRETGARGPDAESGAQPVVFHSVTVRPTVPWLVSEHAYSPDPTCGRRVKGWSTHMLLPAVSDELRTTAPDDSECQYCHVLTVPLSVVSRLRGAVQAESL